MKKGTVIIVVVVAVVAIGGLAYYFWSKSQAATNAGGPEVTQSNTTQTKTGLGNLDLGGIANAVKSLYGK